MKTVKKVSNKMRKNVLFGMVDKIWGRLINPPPELPLVIGLVSQLSRLMAEDLLNAPTQKIEEG